MIRLVKYTFIILIIATLSMLALYLSGYTRTDDPSIVQQIVDKMRAEEVEKSIDKMEKSFSNGSFGELLDNSSTLLQRKFIITRMDVSRPLIGEATSLIAHVRYYQQQSHGLGDQHQRYFQFIYDINTGWKLLNTSNKQTFWMNFLFNQDVPLTPQEIDVPKNSSATQM